MIEVAEAEIARWPRGEPVKLHARMQALTLNVILRVIFGLEQGARLDHLRAALVRMLSLTTNAVAAAFLLVIGPQKTRTALIHRLLREVELLYQEISARRKAEDLDDRTDVLSMLLKARHTDHRPMSDNEIRDELMTLLLAGHETTASALAWAVEQVSRHPDVQSQLQQEARGDCSDYVDAVVKETLRLRPVLSLVIRRLTGPMNIGGVPLPAGVCVAPSIYLMHRRPDIYPEPTQFRPDRFLTEPAGTYTWLPFGGGVRRCLGPTFAEWEMRIVLRSLLSSIQVHPDKRAPEPVHRRGITHVPGRGAAVVLEKRTSTASTSLSQTETR